MKTSESYCFLKVRVEVVKKVSHSCRSAFDNFSGHPLGFFLISSLLLRVFIFIWNVFL